MSVLRRRREWAIGQHRIWPRTCCHRWRAADSWLFPDVAWSPEGFASTTEQARRPSARSASTAGAGSSRRSAGCMEVRPDFCSKRASLPSRCSRCGSTTTTCAERTGSNHQRSSTPSNGRRTSLFGTNASHSPRLRSTSRSPTRTSSDGSRADRARRPLTIHPALLNRPYPHPAMWGTPLGGSVVDLPGKSAARLAGTG